MKKPQTCTPDDIFQKVRGIFNADGSTIVEPDKTVKPEVWEK